MIIKIEIPDDELKRVLREALAELPKLLKDLLPRPQRVKVEPQKSEPEDSRPSNPAPLSMTAFAKKLGITRQTAHKWVRYNRERFPKGSLLLNPQGHYVVDYTAYINGFIKV